MSDKARELLERALNFFEEICDSRSIGIEKSINAYLAEPEVKREAVRNEEVNKYVDGIPWMTALERVAFKYGVRFAEKHHGIEKNVREETPD